MWPKELWSKGLALLFRSLNAVPDETQYPLNGSKELVLARIIEMVEQG